MMAAETDNAIRINCPSCNQKAKRVNTVTLKALLKDEYADLFVANGHACCEADAGSCQPIRHDTGWRFCESNDCEVVYFSEESNTTFAKPQLKVPVGVKETSGERPLCYCFGHSVISIKEELQTKGSSNALDDIRAKMKDPGCHCEVENPSGSCCLGSVAKGIKVAQVELATDSSDLQPVAPSPKPTVNRGEFVAKVGTVVSAVMASACCWLPLVLVAAGVSGAGIASTLEAYRPLFVVVTFAFLAAAFYFTYRPHKGETAENDCCSPPKEKRWSVMALNKAMLWIVTVLAVAFLFFPAYVGVFAGGKGRSTVTDDMHRAEFTVQGMTCEGCASIASTAIRGVPGVLAIEVDYETGIAVVGSDGPVLTDQVVDALQRAGYKGVARQDK